MKRTSLHFAAALLLSAIPWLGQAAETGVESSPAPAVTSTDAGSGEGSGGPGWSAPGAGEAAGDGSGGQAQERPPSATGRMTIHIDRTLRFSVERPDRFLVVPQPAAALAGFDPAPAASVFFVRPFDGEGAGASMEPPDLEVRVFNVSAGVSLDAWLARVGLSSAGTTVEPYHSAGAVGLRVCQTTMIFPNCSSFFLRGGRAYQLTAASQEGEAMAESFALLP